MHDTGMPTSCWAVPKSCMSLPRAGTKDKLQKIEKIRQRKTTRKTQPWYRNASFLLGRSKNLYAFAQEQKRIYVNIGQDRGRPPGSTTVVQECQLHTGPFKKLYAFAQGSNKREFFHKWVVPSCQSVARGCTQVDFIFKLFLNMCQDDVSGFYTWIFRYLASLLDFLLSGRPRRLVR